MQNISSELSKSIWLRRGTLPSSKDKHSVAQKVVCAVESLYGLSYADRNAEMSTPKNWEKTANRTENSY